MLIGRAGLSLSTVAVVAAEEAESAEASEGAFFKAVVLIGASIQQRYLALSMLPYVVTVDPLSEFHPIEIINLDPDLHFTHINVSPDGLMLAIADSVLSHAHSLVLRIVCAFSFSSDFLEFSFAFHSEQRSNCSVQVLGIAYRGPCISKQPKQAPTQDHVGSGDGAEDASASARSGKGNGVPLECIRSMRLILVPIAEHFARVVALRRLELDGIERQGGWWWWWWW